MWESPDAIEAAGEKVRAYYLSIGFDMPAMLVRWGVKAASWVARAPSLLQVVRRGTTPAGSGHR